ncbi:universal stress protein A [Thermosulfidibacter takaii ABI70S6]|uniref:Universal stress protein n=1 Tax=Thermosulfidibacter takaii (strain DSM 17441 / JCM 13301 / NBRC 103674 / ABI70S6) TaxID=1298851 RepID=A0A0S3QR70_THET7|nr:universal stress protein [Thermosulfidibacter takaii]BAT70832.1 universal stress protein A [Thermosulfidibacter takaii ABI70S6]
MFNRILAAIDFSEPITEKVLKTSAELAKLCNAQLFILNVVEKEIPLLISEGLLVPSTDLEVIEKIFDRVTEEALKKLNQKANELKESYGIDVTVIVEAGEPFDTILDKAEEVDVDLIVVGSHSKGGIERLLLGSVSEKVARKAKTNVLIVRLEKEKK